MTPPPPGTALHAERDQVLAFRLASHHLARRLPPGDLLADGQIVGSWRPRTRGQRLTVAITSETAVPPAVRSLIEAEATSLAPYRGCSTVAVTFVTFSEDAAGT